MTSLLLAASAALTILSGETAIAMATEPSAAASTTEEDVLIVNGEPAVKNPVVDTCYELKVDEGSIVANSTSLDAYLFSDKNCENFSYRLPSNANTGGFEATGSVNFSAPPWG